MHLSKVTAGTECPIRMPNNKHVGKPWKMSEYALIKGIITIFIPLGLITHKNEKIPLVRGKEFLIYFLKGAVERRNADFSFFRLILTAAGTGKSKRKRKASLPSTVASGQPPGATSRSVSKALLEN